MNTNKPVTYGELADILNRYDDEDTSLYFNLGNGVYLPIDNYQLFKEATEHDPDELSIWSISEDTRNDLQIIEQIILDVEP